MMPAEENGVAITRCVLPDGRMLCFATDPTDTMIGAEIRRIGRWQDVETMLICSLVESGDHAVDVGAHVGYFTVILSRQVGSAGKVTSFEPEPRNFALLKANCILNGCRNAGLLPCALGAGPARAALFLSRTNLGDHRLHKVAGRAAVPVKVMALDDCLPGKRLDFLKIDAQGGETAILSGATRTIRANAERLLCLMEVSPRLSEAAGYGRERLLALLTSLRARAFTATLPPRALTPAALAALWDRLHATGVEDANDMVLMGFSAPAVRRIAALRPPSDKRLGPAANPDQA